jgi:sugar phosphate isomerase/epimerase
MLRREFLTRLAEGAAAAGLLRSGDKLSAVGKGHASHGGADKRDRIAISTWSFHNYFQSTREKEFHLPGSMLTLLDFPRLIADKYNVHNLEFVASHFASAEPAYLQELKGCLAKAHSHVANIPLDIPEIDTKGGLSDPDNNICEKATEASKKWIDIAAAVGSKSVRCDPGKMNPNDLAPTVKAYKALVAHGQSKGIRVLIENHGGVGSEHPEELVALFKEVGGNFIGALPDFGNFPNEATRAKGLELLFPYAHVVCHAKGLEFDSSGGEAQFDFPRCVEISKKAGYRGVYSIEYEGPGDPYAGVQNVVDELMKYL